MNSNIKNFILNRYRSDNLNVFNKNPLDILTNQ